MINSNFRIMVQRVQMSEAERSVESGTAEVRLYNAIIKTFIDDALSLRKRIDRCLDYHGREGFHIRRGVSRLNMELEHPYTQELCELAGVSQSKLLKTVNHILNGGH